MKKKLLSLLIAAVLIFTACAPAAPKKDDANTKGNETAKNDTNAKEEKKSDSGKQRVVNVYNWGDTSIRTCCKNLKNRRESRSSTKSSLPMKICM